MATSYYSTGSVTLTNGSAVVTGNGTGWQLALISGGNVIVQAPGNVLPIASVDSDTQITAELKWAGASGTYSYTIQRDTAYLKSLDQNSESLSYLISEMRNGTLFKYDAAGTLADRALYDERPKGFSYLVFAGTSAQLYVKASTTSGDWAGPFSYGTGPQGIPGPVGFLDWRGTYTAGTAYERNDGVLYNGSSYVALQATIGNAPPNLPTTENDYWSLLAVKGQDGLGTGDVVGPASAVDGQPVGFDGTTGKLIKALSAPQIRQFVGGWEQIGEVIRTPPGTTETAWGGLGDYHIIRLRWNILPSGIGIGLACRTSRDNGAAWDQGSADYTYHGFSEQSGTLGGIATNNGNAIFIVDTSVGGNMAEGEVCITSFNQENLGTFHTGARYWRQDPVGHRSTTIDGYVGVSGARNALQFYATGGSYAGLFLLEGVRG